MSTVTESKLRSIIDEVIGSQENKKMFGLEDNLFEIGLSSMDFIKVIVRIELEFGIEFDDNDLKISNFENLRKLIGYVEKKLEST